MDSTLTVPKSSRWHRDLDRPDPGITIPRALGYMTLAGLAALFLWLTLRVDLVIFAGVLLAVCLRRAAEALSAPPHSRWVGHCWWSFC
jgi:hypothetical protein